MADQDEPGCGAGDTDLGTSNPATANTGDEYRLARPNA